MKVVITILDGITETSMPFNEFVLYRANHFQNERQLLLVLNKPKKLPKVKIPDNLEIVYLKKNIFKIRNYLKKIIKEFQNNQDDYVIHLHQLKSGFLSQIAMLGTKFKRKTIFTIHSTFSGYSLHNKVFSFIIALLSEYIICVSETSFNDYPNFIKKIKKNRIKFIRNGVDTERIDSVLKNNILKNKKEIKCVYVARIIPIKNHEFLIEVLKNTYNNVKFIFVGNEEESENIKKLCDQYKLNDRVEFTGLIPRNKVFQKIQESDIYISSSTLEGMPISVLEAGYVGLPLIISNIPQHKELANNKEFISVLPFDTQMWVSEINKYAIMSIKERNMLGKKCKEYIQKNFSLQKMHKNYDEIYDKIFKR